MELDAASVRLGEVFEQPLSRDVLVTGKRHFFLKKILLKLSFISEMSTFMENPKIRNDARKAPLIFRAYHRLKESPFFSHGTEEEKEKMEKLVDILPRWQNHIVRATRRDPASEVRNAICTSWSVTMATQAEIGVAAVMGKKYQYDLDDACFLLASEPDVSSSSEEESANADVYSFDPGLAARRARRRALSSAMSLLMARLHILGIDDFVADLAAAGTYSELHKNYEDVFVRISSVLSLSLLAAYTTKKNRSKAKTVLTLIPSWLLSILFKIGDPFKLAVLAMKWMFNIKFPGGNSLLQAVVREIVGLSVTEKKLDAAGKHLDSSVKKVLLSLIEEGGTLALGLQLPEAQKEFVQKELRRRDKQAMVDYAASEDMRFILLECLPLLGRPILDHYETSDFGSQFGEAISCVTALISAIEQKEKESIEASLEGFRMLIFRIFKATAIHNKKVIYILFGWIMEGYADGTEMFDMDAFLKHLTPGEESVLWNEVDTAIVHLEAGGHLAALKIPLIKQLCGPFQKIVASHVSLPAESKIGKGEKDEEEEKDDDEEEEGEKEVEEMPKKRGFFARMFGK